MLGLHRENFPCFGNIGELIIKSYLDFPRELFSLVPLTTDQRSSGVILVIKLDLADNGVNIGLSNGLSDRILVQACGSGQGIIGNFVAGIFKAQRLGPDLTGFLRPAITELLC